MDRDSHGGSVVVTTFDDVSGNTATPADTSFTIAAFC
jgi:hypothetical protein